jgi:hypothetical protein
MADVATIAQGAQIGVENTATPGTAVPADVLLNSISITDGVEGNNETFRPDGHKYPALTIPGKEWMAADFTGKLTYDGDPYILCSLIRSVSPSTVGGIKKWVIAPQNAAEDTHQTYSIEKGGSVRAHSYAYGLIDSVTIDITRDACDLSGTLFAQRITDDVALTGTPTAVALTPVLPRLFDVSLDSTAAALGNTKLLRAFTGRISLSNLVGPVWPIDSAHSSFGTHVELEPSASVTLFVEHDAAGAEFLTILRSGASRFLRLKAVGDAIAGTPAGTYLWQFDVAVKAKSLGKHSDHEGIYGWEVTLDVVNDDTWGKPYEFTIQNTTAAL